MCTRHCRGKSVWYNWTSLTIADTVPGAATFLKYVASKRVEIFYISNRDENEKINTLSNLQRFNLHDADNTHLLVKQATSSKDARRQQVIGNHEILLLLGDNLADFSGLFDKKPLYECLKNTNLNADEFGKRFIVLPSPGYEDWESSLFNYNYSL
jgi:5'-nucleotidase (lipoprotein e(P4) family)